jgi:hypothetical protein
LTALIWPSDDFQNAALKHRKYLQKFTRSVRTVHTSAAEQFRPSPKQKRAQRAQHTYNFKPTPFQNNVPDDHNLLFGGETVSTSVVST